MYLGDRELIDGSLMMWTAAAVEMLGLGGRLVLFLTIFLFSNVYLFELLF